jgi:hypothetical protein
MGGALHHHRKRSLCVINIVSRAAYFRSVKEPMTNNENIALHRQRDRAAAAECEAERQSSAISLLGSSTPCLLPAFAIRFP